MLCRTISLSFYVHQVTTFVLVIMGTILMYSIDILLGCIRNISHHQCDGNPKGKKVPVVR